jgi:hypothetical protein
MMDEILSIANPMIGETALPDFGIATDERAEFVGVSAFDQLDSALDGNVLSRSKHEMDVIGHGNEGV